MTAPIAEQIRLFAVFLSQFRHLRYEAAWLPKSLDEYGVRCARECVNQLREQLYGSGQLAIHLRESELSDLLFGCSQHAARLWMRLDGIDPNYTNPIPELADLRRLLDAALEADPDPMWYQPPAIPADECNAAAREAVAA